MERGKLVRSLAQIVGSSNVTTEPEQIIACGFRMESRPEVLVFPGSKEELQEIVWWAINEELPLVPLGSGSEIRRVLDSFQRGIGVSLQRLNRFVELEPDNLSVRVEAGAVNSELQEVLCRNNLFLPVFPDYPQSTIGGEVAADTAGRKRYRYGSIGDYVLGLEFISPGGKLVKTGGKTVKNVSGYDFTKLLAGSWGTLGVITEVTLKLRPLPEVESLVLVSFDGFSNALEMAWELMGRRLTIVSLEILWPASQWRLLDCPGEIILLVVLEGSREAVTEHRKQVQEVITGRPAQWIDERLAISRFWENYHRFRWEMKTSNFFSANFDKRLTAEIVERIFSKSEKMDMQVGLDVGSGVLDFSLTNYNEMPRNLLERWLFLQAEYGEDRVRLSFAAPSKQLLLEKLWPKIDPQGIMFPTNALLRGVNRGSGNR
ncbi:FAD-binding oxidoreductase [Calderihabitans maritimus]|uniref:FAD/FMN-dependent dehydrogenase n=1 Tax=Calderihabitans maritimus TaxID=1246530 RepID=A0A1Z5HW72_9FIRM|nr:FAD-binding oxidoreductase [Calderihabitans maritimus]GAW93786.1 FAD/FMN-dependent dehydrogenase [Calderihabitans maritimus]